MGDYREAVEMATARVARLTAKMAERTATWEKAPLVTALQALRGVEMVSAVTLVAEIGDFRRFATASDFMSFVGLVPSEHSSGGSRRQGRITRTGNTHVRRILVESARRKKCAKHGGQMERVDLDDVELPLPMPEDELLLLDEALDRLATVDTRAADLVKLCFFAGLTQEQAAQELDVSRATAERIWAFARAWLFREMQKTRDAAR